ncbi:hypothetical protein DESUT3_21260 [Desulfuromonas versatilis]|uniref:Zinc ribbon domain-containing protein n=1 Tax=Desulfuromonas versatilis TaxID=2802975 RepID=A0ABN6DY52_9BACT|nr:hypothetical protein [Desulfuromonas versatilis]BCR05057.1 hypothetical protein DESUT3_21260 [Desulfuromonas versatilis]
MSKVTCKKCNKAVVGEGNFCKNCGTSLAIKKQKKSKKRLIVMAAVLFVSAVMLEQLKVTDTSAQKLTTSTTSGARIPYKDLLADNINDERISTFQGWDIGKKIHNKYGFQSSQKVLFDPKTLIFKSKNNIEKFLGKPVFKDDNTFKYKTDYGFITANFYNKICYEIKVEFNSNFTSYVDVLKAINVERLKKPFGVNDATLKYDDNLGNGIIKYCEKNNCIGSIMVHLPNSNTENKWAITLFGVEN